MSYQFTIRDPMRRVSRANLLKLVALHGLCREILSWFGDGDCTNPQVAFARSFAETLPLAESAFSKGIGWVFQGTTSMILIPEPEYRVDADLRLHAEDGSAMIGMFGTERFSWHGVEVPSKVILERGGIQPAEVLREPNTEVRRVKIERLGFKKFMKASGAALVQEDDFGRLFRLKSGKGATISAVAVTCPSTGREFFLRVPPRFTTPRDAVAWTFRMKGSEYRPKHQT